MSKWVEFSYSYDGSFAGFLTCVFESYLHKELPACFTTPEDPRVTLWPERAVETDEDHAGRVYRSLSRRISPEAQSWVCRGFLTCMPEKERRLWAFIRRGYQVGPVVTRDLADPQISALNSALTHLKGEVHLLRGFVRFSQQEGILVAEIAPKNRVLPLLRPHFCARYSGESFVIYDRTHKEALFYHPGQWVIAPLEEFHTEGPDREELDYRRLWRRFYDTIAIEGRYNPKCRMTHMPKRYWGMMTEFQREDGPSAGAQKRLDY